MFFLGWPNDFWVYIVSCLTSFKFTLLVFIYCFRATVSHGKLFFKQYLPKTFPSTIANQLIASWTAVC